MPASLENKMTLPSLSQVKWFALIFAAFFALTSALQYLFVRYTTVATITADLADSAANVSRVVQYQDSVDPMSYSKAFLDTGDFAAILKDGSILDIEFRSGLPLQLGLGPIKRIPMAVEI